MNKDEELKTRYYNLIEEEERIQRSANELALERAKESGIKEGIEKGIKEGIEQGVEKGKVEIIVNMYKDNTDIDTIAKCSNLTIEDVEEILKESKNQEG